jgi:hypothetical protein
MVIFAGAWLVLAVAILGTSILIAPRVVAPAFSGAPQGTADLFSYYAAWWLLCGVGLGALCHSRGLGNPYRRSWALTSVVMIFSLVVAVAFLTPVLYPGGEYVNLGFQSVYLVLAALVVPNVILGTIGLWRALRLPLGFSLMLCSAWAVMFVAGLGLAAAVVDILQVGTQRS